MSMRHDFNHDISDSPNERRIQQEALSRLRAEKGARAVLDREQAARDINAKWAAEQVRASRPAPVVGAQQAARDAMIRRTAPGWTPEPAANPARAAAAWRMDSAPAPANGIRSAAEARAMMMRKLGGR